MAEDRNRINLSLSPKMLRYVEQLVALGLYGDDRTKVAYRFLEEGIRRAVEAGVVSPDRAD
jgi:hypothetical protein